MPLVATRTLEAAGVSEPTGLELVRSLSVSVVGATDVLEFSVSARDAALATRLATEYGVQFKAYRLRLDTSQLKLARANVAAAIKQLETTGGTRSQLSDSLVDQQAQLRTLETAIRGNVRVISPATSATRILPAPLRATVLFAFIGLILGVVLAFVREALDTRVRSIDDVLEGIGLPLLGSLPAAHGRSDSKLVQPAWSLAARFELARADAGSRVVMVASGTTGEGRSRAVAALGLALARGGRRVIVVDLDPHDPPLGRFFGVEEASGLTDVAAGDLDLDGALVPIPMTFPDPDPAADQGYGQSPASLDLLPAGRLPQDPAWLLTPSLLGGLLHDDLGTRADIVLVDTPGMLERADALTVARAVDAMLLVVGLHVVRRSQLEDLTRLADSLPVTKLGLAVTGGQAGERPEPLTVRATPAVPAGTK